MKKIPSIDETLDNLFDGACINYTAKKLSKNSVLNFELCYENKKFFYSLYATKKSLTAKKELSDKFDLSIKCNAIDWINIAAGRMNPLISIVTGKLKYKGDVKLIKAVFENDINSDRPWRKFKDKIAEYEFKNKRKWKKPKKVVAICGAPGGRKGCTFLIMNHLLNGMKEAKAEVEKIILSEYKIKSCTGCFRCWFVTNGRCVINDDMKRLNKKILNADLIVYAFPLYVGGVPGLLKNFIDRSIQNNYPFFIQGISHVRHPRRMIKERFTVVLSGSGYPELNNFDPVVKHFDDMQENRHSPVLEYLLLPQIVSCFGNPLMYPLLLEKLECLKIAGKQLIERGRVERRILKVISRTISKKYTDTWIYYTNNFMQELVDKKAKEY